MLPQLGHDNVLTVLFSAGAVYAELEREAVLEVHAVRWECLPDVGMTEIVRFVLITQAIQDVSADGCEAGVREGAVT